MELRHLTAFLAVAEELHFSRAAERLRIAQPSLSQLIKQLERELGVRLFERSTRSVRLTTAGESFLEPTRTALADIELASWAARAAATGEHGRVTVGFSGAGSHESLPLLARAVRAAHPGIELVLRGQTYSNHALAKVADGTFDLGFVRLPVMQPGLSSRVIGREELIVALPTDHVLAAQPAIELAQLANEPFVILPVSSGSLLRDAAIAACSEAGFTPRIIQEAPDSYTILALVAAGVGVTLTLTTCQHIQRTGAVFRPLAGPPLTLHPALAWRRDNPSAALRTVLAVAETALPTWSPPTA